jgi:hypothetical protein
VFDEAIVLMCIDKIDAELPDIWAAVVGNELDQSSVTDEDYLEYWDNIRLVLHRMKITEGALELASLCLAMRWEMRRRLGLPIPQARRTSQSYNEN